MDPLLAHIKKNFDESIQTKATAKESLAESILKASQQLVTCLKDNKKILICGNGGSAAESQHLASELMNRFLIERPSLPAIALTTDTSTITSIANDYSYDQIFSKQIQALGQEGDTLILISTSGHSKNILQAYEAAKDKKLTAIALTGNKGGQLATLLKCDTADIELCIPSSTTARIQEMHLFIIHCLCDLIDKQLYSN